MSLALVPTEVVDEQPTFADFWLLYPKRIAKMEAEKAWNRTSAAERVESLTALIAWRSVWIAEGRLQFVPNASTWINQKRWSDELPESWGASHASHIAAAMPERGVKVAMPDHVKAAIAKLRAR